MGSNITSFSIKANYKLNIFGMKSKYVVFLNKIDNVTIERLLKGIKTKKHNKGIADKKKGKTLAFPSISKSKYLLNNQHCIAVGAKAVAFFNGYIVCVH